MVADRSWLRRVEHDMTAVTGRRSSQPWLAIFVVLQITAIEGLGRLLRTHAAGVADRLNDSQRKRLGMVEPMKYSHLESAIADLDAAMRVTVDTESGELRPARLSVGLDGLVLAISTSSSRRRSPPRQRNPSTPRTTRRITGVARGGTT